MEPMRFVFETVFPLCPIHSTLGSILAILAVFHCLFSCFSPEKDVLSCFNIPWSREVPDVLFWSREAARLAWGAFTKNTACAWRVAIFQALLIKEDLLVTPMWKQAFVWRV